MNSIVFQETAKLKKPVPPEKVIELSDKLEPSNHSKKYPLITQNMGNYFHDCNISFL